LSLKFLIRVSGGVTQKDMWLTNAEILTLCARLGFKKDSEHSNISGINTRSPSILRFFRYKYSMLYVNLH
jgi:hypothetical protein